MPTPTPLEIHEAAEQAIYDLLVDGKASATCLGRSYTAHDIQTLQQLSEFYRLRAIAAGTITTSDAPPTVSYARIAPEWS